MPMSTRSSVPWASSSTSTAIRCNARDLVPGRLGLSDREFLQRTLELDRQRAALTAVQHAIVLQTGNVILEKGDPLLGWRRRRNDDADQPGTFDRKTDEPRGLAPIHELVDISQTIPLSKGEGHTEGGEQEVVRQHATRRKTDGDESGLHRAASSEC